MNKPPAKVLFAVLLLLLAHGGCQPQSHVCSSQLNDVEAALKLNSLSRSNSKVQDRVEIRVRYVGQPSPFSYLADDQSVGTNVHELMFWLASHRATDVVFESEYKLTPARVLDFVKAFNLGGITVNEFWVPRSSTPGRVDLMRRQKGD